jgi:hypothetical protein
MFHQQLWAHVQLAIPKKDSAIGTIDAAHEIRLLTRSCIGPSHLSIFFTNSGGTFNRVNFTSLIQSKLGDVEADRFELFIPRNSNRSGLIHISVYTYLAYLAKNLTSGANFRRSCPQFPHPTLSSPFVADEISLCSNYPACSNSRRRKGPEMMLTIAKSFTQIFNGA